MEEGQRLKVIYGSSAGFHAVDVDSGNSYDIYIPVHVSWAGLGAGRGRGRGGGCGGMACSAPSRPQIQSQITPHAIIFLPDTDGMEMLLCYEDEGVYVNTYGRIIKDVVLQWGEMPTSVGKRRARTRAAPWAPGPQLPLKPTHWPSCPSPPAYICSNQIMGWGEKAIEIRSVETGHLDGVFMHKRAQRLKFLCERNDKVGAPGPAPAGGLGWGWGSPWGLLGVQPVSQPPSLPPHHHGAALSPSNSAFWGGGALKLNSAVSSSPPLAAAQPRPPSLLTSPTRQVFFASVRSGGSSQVYFMTLNRNCIMNW